MGIWHTDHALDLFCSICLQCDREEERHVITYHTASVISAPLQFNVNLPGTFCHSATVCGDGEWPLGGDISLSIEVKAAGGSRCKYLIFNRGSWVAWMKLQMLLKLKWIVRWSIWCLRFWFEVWIWSVLTSCCPPFSWITGSTQEQCVSKQSNEGQQMHFYCVFY